MNFWNTLFGDPNEKELSKIRPLVKEINDLESTYQAKSDQELTQETAILKERISQGSSLNELIPPAFALVREAATRTLSQRHYDVQLIGGIILHQGKIAEMRTGEGKTLVGTLPTYLNALEGKGAHVITVNDYLAKRDAVWMGQIYNFLGLSVGVITGEGSFLYTEFDDETQDQERDESGFYRVEKSYLQPCTRQEAYAADITYGTNNEFGFDYLRDNLAQNKNQQVQRELHYVIIDEVDSVLIDEARTPLIISAPNAESPKLYQQFARIVPKLNKDTDYSIDEKMRSVNITESGIDKVEKALGIDNIYEDKGIAFVHHLEQALKAQALFVRDKDYVVKDQQVIIVDQFTGRMMQGRRYSEGLHQALEAKENVPVQQESKTLATVTYQNYFRMYQKLSGMTGTAVTSAEEFHKVYDLDVIIIPTNKPIARKDLADMIYKTEQIKFKAIAKKVYELSQTGQPVLLGTVSIEKSEQLARVFDTFDLKYNILNAKQHESEGQIVADAGRKGSITIATNMAGRGVDIRLGGAESTPEEKAEVEALGGLYVIGTERHEARRIDNQLRGRSGRQGEQGVTQFYLSLDDEIMRIFGGDRIRGLMERFNFPDDEPIENVMISKAIENAQTKIEGFHFDSRKNLLEYDDVINKQREIIYKKRRDILHDKLDIVSQTRDLLQEQVYRSVSFHTTIESVREWNIQEIGENIKGLITIDEDIFSHLEVIRDGQDSMDAKKEAMIGYLTQTVYTAFEQKLSPLEIEQRIQLQRTILLQTIDMLWMDHLEVIDYLKTGIRLRGYAQRDPLVEYKNEAFLLFEKLLLNITEQYIINLLRINVQITPKPPEEFQKVSTNRPSSLKGGLDRESDMNRDSGQTEKSKKLSKKKLKRLKQKERRQ